MPKRKNSDPDEYNHLAKKIRKIVRKLKKARRRDRWYCCSPRGSCDQSLHEISNYEEGKQNVPKYPIESEVISDEELQAYQSVRSVIVTPEQELDMTETVPMPEMAASSVAPTLGPAPAPALAPAPAPAPAPGPSLEPLPGPSHTDAPEVQLDSDVLDILGEDPTAPKVLSKEILPALAVRLEHIATSGLASELRKELQSKYVVPSNCPLIGVPSLNPEVKAAITDSVLKRDQSIEGKQKQLAVAISCITEAITPLMSNDKKDPAQLQLLMDAVRMLCDIQYKHTSIRRGLLLNNLKKDLKDQIQGTKVDSYLFGQNFRDNLKTAKAISKSGAELKPSAPKPVPPKKPGLSGPPKKTFPSMSQHQHLNWKAPPPGRRPMGTQRTTEPAAKRNIIRTALLKRSIPPSSLNIMMASLSENSIRQYDSCLKKWFHYCKSNNLDMYETSVPNLILFLTELFNNGAQFGTLNSCRSALSLISGKQIGDDDRVKRFFRGVFRLRPSLPKYSITWDTSIVLNFLSNWYPNFEINFENLTKKLITLLALITAHRMQTLSKVNISNIEQHPDNCN
ncbi:hypothetical protein ACJJTC_014314 [Scirpophaga incertulas]